MSLILDALKKLDREKSTRGDRETDIAAEILGPDLPRRGKRVRLYVATVFLTAVAATAITYAAIVRLGFVAKSSSPSHAGLHAAGEQTASALPSREPARDDRRKPSNESPSIQSSAATPKAAESQSPGQKKQVAAAPPSGQSVHGGRDEMSRVPQKIEKPAENKKSLTSIGEKKASQPIISEKGDTAPKGAEKTAEHAPSLSAADPSSLKISGIVWHEEPSRRLAVINGIVTHEGSVVEGVKIVEISPDRVHCSQEGLHFEIPFR